MARQKESGGRSDGGREKYGMGGWTWILSFVGLSLLGAGGYLALAPRLGPDATWIALSLSKAGVQAGTVVVGGVVLLGMAIVCAGQSRLVRGAHSLPRISRDLGELRKGQKRLADRFGTLHLEMSVLQEANKTLLRAAQDQSAVQAAGMQVDATFRLAASMDQLGARLEGRLEDQRSDLESRLGDLNGSVRETRAHVEQWLRLHFDELGEEDPDRGEVELEEAEEWEPSLTLEGFGPGEDGPDWDPDTPAELPEFDDLEELEILVTLDEDEETEEDSPFLDLRPWGESEIDEEEGDEVWCEEAHPSPLEVEALADPLSWNLEEDEEVDLGLLDVLDEDGTLIDGKEAPPVAESMPSPPPIGSTRDTEVEQEDDPGPALDPPSLIREELTDEVLKEALDTIKRRRGM